MCNTRPVVPAKRDRCEGENGFPVSAKVFAAIKESAVPIKQRESSTGAQAGETLPNQQFTPVGMVNNSSPVYSVPFNV